MHAKLTFVIKAVTLSHSGRHFYSKFRRIGKFSFVRFDEILVAFRIGLQVHKMKVVTLYLITVVKYTPEEQCGMQYTRISSNHGKENLLIHMNQL